MNTEKIKIVGIFHKCWWPCQSLSCFWCGHNLFGTNTIGGCFMHEQSSNILHVDKTFDTNFPASSQNNMCGWLAGWLGDSAQICTYSKQLVIILQLRTGQQLCITSVCGWQFCTKQRFWQQTTRVPGDHFAQGITSVYGWQFCTNAQSKNPA